MAELLTALLYFAMTFFAIASFGMGVWAIAAVRGKVKTAPSKDWWIIAFCTWGIFITLVIVAIWAWGKGYNPYM
jgi:hypothetical protein